MNDTLTTEPWSAGYDLVHNTEIFQTRDDEAAMDVDMLRALEEQFGSPLVGYVGGLHYQFKAESSVPPKAVTVPRRNHDDPRALLIQR